MKEVLLVGLGSAVGGMLRYLIGKTFVLRIGAFSLSWGTLAVNWVGCLLLGILLGLVSRGAPFTAEIRTLLMAGFCGGFTTFSTFSADSIALLRQGEAGLMLLYLLASVIGGLLLVWCGMLLARGS